MSAKSSDPREKTMAAGRQLEEALLSASEALKTIAGIVPSLFPANDSFSVSAPIGRSSTDSGRNDTAGTTPATNKRKRKEKDPDAPEKPPSAYHIYAKEKRDEIKQVMGGTPSANDVIHEINRRWKELAEDLKKPFNDAAEKLKDTYKKALATYEETKGGNSEEAHPSNASKKPDEPAPIAKPKATPAKGGFTAVKASPLAVHPENASDSESESQDEAAVAADLGGSHPASVSPAKRQRTIAKKADGSSAKETKEKPKDKAKEKEKEKEKDKKKRRRSGKSEG